jgi:hypothetical protein
MAVVGGAVCSIACATSTDSARAEPSPEEAWLSSVGSGAAQTARVCSRGARDRIARTLCDSSTPPIHSLNDLYRALRLDQADARFVAAAGHSLGLPARTVSGANPRVIVGAKHPPSESFDYEQVVSLGFSRGQQLVELVGLDPTNYEYNFYLLHFRQACNIARCTPEDLLTERLEGGWTDWTLYSDQDLEDTPLDCLTCHLPFGAGTHKLLVMRQTIDPWMHWSDFRTGDEHLCPSGIEKGPPYRIIATSRGLDPIQALEGPSGRYAGISLEELRTAKSGEDLAAFLADAELLIRASPHAPYPYAQLDFRTRETLCERFYDGTSPTWDEERKLSQSHGLPVPYYQPDVFDPGEHPELMADRKSFLQARSSSDAFDVAASLLSPDVAPSVGFVPRPEDSAADILRGMCRRCHAASTDPQLRRARFNADAIDAIEASTARAIRARLSLPKSSPALMPPRVVGVLPDWAIERIVGYLREHCVQLGGCE